MLDIGPIHRSEYELNDDRSAPIVIAEAPGRIHYLGEHGEPKAGLYLSSVIDRRIKVAVSPRKDGSLRFYAADTGERKRATLANLRYKKEDRWANYLKVVIQMFSTLGYVAKGLNFTIAGDIPQHIGFASSAALETAAMLALKSLYHAQIKLEELPLRLSEAQETFFGFRENIVDYIVMLQARKDTFLVIDEKDLSVRRIKSPFSGYRLFVLDSRVPRAGVEEDLQYLNKELERGLKQLSPGQKKATFRDFVSNDTVESTVTLNEEVRRRCLHVVQELRRVNDAEKALTNADIPAFARIVYHSHESLRDLFEVSCPEIDWMVKRAQETEGVMGSRMTGKGFGGCTYSFIRASASEETGAVPVEEFKKNLEDYERIFGFHPMPYDFSIGSGAKVIAA